MNSSPKNKSPEPIFLVGYSRSGTTWMNTALRDYLDIGLANEGQFIIKFGKRYRPNEPIRNLEKLIKALAQDQFFDLLHRVYGISIDWPKLHTTPQPQNYSGIIRLILEEIAEKLQKQFIGSKSPGFGWDMDVLLSHFPRCRIIHLIRDGRDCALSHYQRLWGRQNAYAAAVNWQKQIWLIREKVERSATDYIEVRYEDLLRNPKTEFNRLASFVLKGGKKGPNTFAYNTLTEEFASSLESTDYEKRTCKWKRQMSEWDQKVFESVAGKTLDNLGYETTGNVVPLSNWLCLAYQVDDKAKREFMHAASKILKVPYGGKKSTLALKLNPKVNSKITH